MLGERESIKAIIDDWGSTWASVSSPCLVALMESGHVTNANTTSFLDQDLDMVLWGGFGTSFDSIDYKVAVTEYNDKNPVEVRTMMFNKDIREDNNSWCIFEYYVF